MNTNAEASRKLEHALETGHIERVDSASLEAHVLALVNHPETANQKDVIRASWVNRALLQRQLDKLDRRSSRLYWILAGIAFVTIVNSLGQLIATLSPAASRVESRGAASGRLNTPAGRESTEPSSAKSVEEGLGVYQHEDGTWTWRHVKAVGSRDSTHRFENYSDAVNDALRNGFLGGTITTLRKGSSRNAP
jgi:hypothetical protein